MKSDAILDRLLTLHPKVIDLSLDRMHRLLAALGHPERDLPPVTHIAGTNGKGSTLAMMRAGLEGAGLRVHAYTSPHLARFHERIRVAGDLITERALAALLEECEAANEGAPITFFEITTAAAFLAFARAPADHLLLEVGLGGRLDATNVIDPALTVITPVSMDHQAFLGDTLPKIAAEKAGILKPRTPCIVGPQEEEALEVIEYRAARLSAPLRIHGQHWHAAAEDGRLVVTHEAGLIDLPLPALRGPHQIANAGTAIMALRELGQGDPDAAMTRAHWPARMQRLTHHPLNALAPRAELWLDGGHNPAAGAALAATLAGLPARETHAICGLLNTKDATGYFAPLAPHLAHIHAIAIPGEKATLPPDAIAAAARAAGLSATPSEDLTAALVHIVRTAPEARILICGSLYLAGHVLRMDRPLG
ncbi:bifunctional folylpolyglutamate synthase/dihydrofolate synthase [Jannaschia aquimarina]|uniref:Dihydrofolate synthase/folylpolyglutamate synthase n=1 Tax=Jannaschia aquimarina TaxID=935700 RepID=A0A0D1EFF6_9RHOB|nr:folylpolyglutamate synthase/dihydrofolate synthase family protein [Jannaschia aquimarina]KIT16354.1 Bifunctional protein FolC [Jannaschia aquimarina]SNT25710.1 dihydrofolate synthase / folylpolyglutamate synthase [Jannaschia aquimarina]